MTTKSEPSGPHSSRVVEMTSQEAFRLYCRDLVKWLRLDFQGRQSESQAWVEANEEGWWDIMTEAQRERARHLIYRLRRAANRGQ